MSSRKFVTDLTRKASLNCNCAIWIAVAARRGLKRAANGFSSYFQCKSLLLPVSVKTTFGLSQYGWFDPEGEVQAWGVQDRLLRLNGSTAMVGMALHDGDGA